MVIMNELAQSQQQAYKLMQSGANVFLTGGAGVGKSFLLRKYINEFHGNCLVTAPSGIAAQRVNGVTVHSAFNVPRKIVDDGDFVEEAWLLTDDERKELKATNKMNVLLNSDVLIIDEISMLRADVFSYVMKIIKTIQEGGEKDGEKVKKHKIQIILCGDFFQLPPVIAGSSNDKNSEKYIFEKILYKGNKSGYAFKTEEWQNMNIKTVILTDIVRQKDPKFANALNQIRRCDVEGLTYVNKHAAKQEQKGPILCGTNKEVAKENEKRFSNLSGPLFKSDIIYDGVREDRKNLCCDEHLELKIGAKVLFLVNDINKENNEPQRYKNGSYGIVKDFDINESGDDTIKVDVDGILIDVKRATWDVNRYEVVSEEKNGKEIKRVKLIKVGSYSQFPLRLGWALTIHKAQGQDYDTLNINPSRIWAPGQLYVALSRAKSIDQLYLSTKLTANMLVTSQSVIDFYKQFDLNPEESNIKKCGWGGARKGAGRKKKKESERHKTRSISVTDDEYIAVKQFLDEYRMEKRKQQ